MQDFKGLKIWDKSRMFYLNIYTITSSFPKEELYGLTNQLRRAALSIGANIAEGSGRMSNKEFAKFLYYSMGSVKECEHYLIISKELNFINENNSQKLKKDLDEIARMLSSLLQILKLNIIQNKNSIEKQSTAITTNHILQTTN